MRTRLWAFPVAVAFLLPANFLICYRLASWYQHAQPVFCFISDLGSYPPESCIFGQFCNITAILIGLIMYFRHRQTIEFFRHAIKSKRRFIACSNVFLWVGFAAAFGLSMVGNFQQTAFLYTHWVGSLMAFGGGLIYCWSQAIFTYLMELPILHQDWAWKLRLSISVIGTVLFFIMNSLTYNRPFEQYTQGKRINYVEDCPLWKLGFVTEDNPGYVHHVITIICEWTITFLFLIYFSSYALELRHLALIPPKVTLTIHHSEFPKDDGHECDVSRRQPPASSSTPEALIESVDQPSVIETESQIVHYGYERKGLTASGRGVVVVRSNAAFEKKQQHEGDKVGKNGIENVKK